jgi:hypothetical protein
MLATALGLHRRSQEMSAIQYIITAILLKVVSNKNQR